MSVKKNVQELHLKSRREEEEKEAKEVGVSRKCVCDVRDR